MSFLNAILAEVEGRPVVKPEAPKLTRPIPLPLKKKTSLSSDSSKTVPSPTTALAQKLGPKKAHAVKKPVEKVTAVAVNKPKPATTIRRDSKLPTKPAKKPSEPKKIQKNDPFSRIVLSDLTAEGRELVSHFREMARYEWYESRRSVNRHVYAEIEKERRINPRLLGYEQAKLAKDIWAAYEPLIQEETERRLRRKLVPFTKKKEVAKIAPAAKSMALATQSAPQNATAARRSPIAPTANTFL